MIVLVYSLLVSNNCNLCCFCRVANSEFTMRKLSCSLRKSSKESKGPTKRIRKKKALENFLPSLSQTNKDIMATSSLFKYTELLPHYGLLSKSVIEATRPGCQRMMFTEAEDNLLALGISQFDKDFKLIHAHLLPAKSPKQLQIRCKNKTAARAPENVIKHYRQTKELWPMPREISNNLAAGQYETLAVKKQRTFSSFSLLSYYPREEA